MKFRIIQETFTKKTDEGPVKHLRARDFISDIRVLREFLWEGALAQALDDAREYYWGFDGSEKSGRIEQAINAAEV